MLIVLARRVGGPDVDSQYEVSVRINDLELWSGKVRGHNRRDGWTVLLRQIADAADRDQEPTP